MKLFISFGSVFLLMTRSLAIDANVEMGVPRVLRGGGGMGYGGGGGGMGQGGGDGGGGGGWNQERMEIIHKLLEYRSDIKREISPVTAGPYDLVTTTTSQKAEVAGWIKTHVAQMMDLVGSGGRIRNWDPLFNEIFDHVNEIQSDVNDVVGGVEVFLAGTTVCGKALAEKHAAVVSAFLLNGYEELHQSHQAPSICDE
jgi:uncharacterized protein